MIYLAVHISEGCYKKMRRYFKEIDKNRDGTIQFGELRDFLFHHKDLSLEIDERIYKLMFDIIDQNKNGNIEYREFVAATIRKTLFKDLVYDEENIEVANIKEVDADF